MESEKTIEFLPKPKIKADKLKYVLNSKKVYANLYQIKIKKQLKLYQYPYKVTPTLTEGDIRIREKLFKVSNRKLKQIFGECFISGDSLYSMKKVEELHTIKSTLYLKGKTDYTIEFNKYENEKIIKQDDIHKDPLSKQFIELIINDILHANPKLEFYKGVFVISSDKKKVETDNVSITFYPGFTTSFMETDKGNFLNVTVKNKIIQNESIYDYLQQYNYEDKNIQKKIKNNLKGRSFKVCYAKRNYRIDDILFEKKRTPKEQTLLYEGKTRNLVDYYEIAHKLKIKDVNQPLILVKRTDSQGEPISLYFVPEFCSLAGLEDQAVKDGYFMRKLAELTKLEPYDRVSKTDEFLELLKYNKKDPENPDKMTSKEKSDFYGIEVEPVNDLFTAYYMRDTKLIGGNNKDVHSNDRTFNVLKKKDLSNWLCFYEKSNYSDAENLYNNLSKASKAFGLKIAEPEWIEMPNKSKAKDWTDTADDYFGEGKNDYDFVVFLLGKNDSIYTDLKIHSLCTNGYVSQVVKAKSIQKKGVMSVCSKILLQINAKLGGISYKASIDQAIKDSKLMVVGVDSSHIKGEGTGVAMVATINDSFTNFYNQEKIIEEENKEQLEFCVSSFIKEAIAVYKKENKNQIPKGIIIYRQGVSLQQKEYLKKEIRQIDDFCGDKILYYYILVNTKTTFKFFETSEDDYFNPGSGLLVIDGVTNRNFFEFYIQPQEVTQGSATPTCFHVAYGNLDFPELIPKFTFDLCHIYSNWQGTVRMPNVIKAAEKLSKMTAKYTHGKLNENLEIGQAYL